MQAKMAKVQYCTSLAMLFMLYGPHLLSMGSALVKRILPRLRMSLNLSGYVVAPPISGHVKLAILTTNIGTPASCQTHPGAPSLRARIFSRALSDSSIRCSLCCAMQSASFEGSGLALHDQPVRRANNPLDYCFIQFSRGERRLGEKNAHRIFFPFRAILDLTMALKNVSLPLKVMP